MRLTVTISCYEQRHPASTVGIDAFCRKSHYSRLEHYTTWRVGAHTPLATSSTRTQIARLSGRQDSNLRPLVPQTSPHFPMSAEFDLELFCGELVGMTTSAGAMESTGIPSTRSHICWTLLPSPTALDFGHSEIGRASCR